MPAASRAEPVSCLQTGANRSDGLNLEAVNLWSRWFSCQPDTTRTSPSGSSTSTTSELRRTRNRAALWRTGSDSNIQFQAWLALELLVSMEPEPEPLISDEVMILSRKFDNQRKVNRNEKEEMKEARRRVPSSQGAVPARPPSKSPD